MDLRYVKKLIDIIDDSTVDSIEISSDKGMKIRISKSPSQRGTVQMAAPVPMAPMVAAAEPRVTPAQGLSAMPAEGEAAPARAAAAPAGLEVKSPMVGTYYHAPEPGAKAYVSVGARVAKGQVLCIIEAMKIMNEIESEYAGVVKEILVEDSAPVEYGQVLFRIDPNG
ncbi:MAG: acetyl-CoA carboxylase biotin carboxyl carrier protein [Gemmatimonadota bacterium]|nr:acetyl-CoA carboxylase biotin carboxyl carrier protein [Gemmatimonadota bacterium]MDE3126511.1 acetyl-CoA carboxylase biotin carboxyl carrier protein [Gemmatimonadota bacterium]MDE3172728.1 acetyl-CoA carboxylase biotin carboxyl carrier protein [Gemmatimonadota bacterium]MDE3215500.1 acetyl-CoA carboxylase biotin carboxyl carrier protein [Gemmatimonadota bacterium]